MEKQSVIPGVIPPLYGVDHDFPRRIEKPTTRLMIASIPRTGSTLLCTLLWRTGVLGAPMEYLNLLNRDHDMVPRLGSGSLPDYWRELQHVRTSPNGVFSFKAFPQDFRQLAGRSADMLAEIWADKVVYLRRRDKLAQAVSYSRAFHSGKWFADVGERTSPQYDSKIISQAMSWIEDLEKGWELLFERKGCEPHRIFYEDIDRDAVRVVDEIVDFVCVAKRGALPLGIPPP